MIVSITPADNLVFPGAPAGATSTSPLPRGHVDALGVQLPPVVGGDLRDLLLFLLDCDRDRGSRPSASSRSVFGAGRDASPAGDRLRRIA